MKGGKSFMRVLLTVVMLLCAMCFVACGQGNTGGDGKGTYYLYENGQLDKSVYIELDGEKWTDSNRESGTYILSGNIVTFYEEIRGENIEILKGTLKDGVLTITANGMEGVFCKEGKMPSTSSQPSDQAVYRGNESNPYYELISAKSRYITNYTINENCKIIADNAFKDCGRLTSVVIPDGVTSIGARVFYNCTSLTSVTIGNGVTSISEYAFYGCSKLTSITIPDSVTSIGEYAFSGCSGLTSVTIGNGVTSIGNHAFGGCSGLANVTIPDSVTSIGYAAFIDCSGLTSIVIPDNVTSVGEYAFSGCSGVTSVTIGNGVTFIGYAAFIDCSGLTSIVIPDNVTSVGEYVFSGCSGLTSVTIGNGVNFIGESTFQDCSGLTSVTIGNGVTSIGEFAFRRCSGLTSIAIPDNVTSIGAYAFSGCIGLESMTLPFIGTQLNGTENTHFGYIFGASYSSDNSKCVPDSLKTVIISNGSGVTFIGYQAFQGCTSLTSVTIPSGVTSIGEYAFSGCSGLTSITIPNSVTSIGSSAFYNCNGLENIYITDIAAWCKISEIGNLIRNGSSNKKLYLNNELITDLVIPDSVTSIGDYAFFDCSKLTNITIPNGVTSIGYAAFSGCSGLESITLPFIGARLNGDEKAHFGYIFGASYFSDNSECVPSSLKTVIISNGSGVTSIGYAAFKGCSGLTNITIPDGITSIGGGAFSGCSSLTSVTIPDSVTSIGSWAFENCSKLENIYITDIAAWCNISGIGTLMSYGSSNKKLYLNNELITDLVIPDSVISIGDYAFSGCSGLTNVTISDSVTSIGEYAFYNCNGFENIYITDIAAWCKISGLSNLMSYGSSSKKLYLNNELMTNPVIPDSITSIGYAAFRCCGGFESITLPFIGAQLDGTEDTHFGYIFGASYSSDNSSYVPSSLKTVIISNGSGVTSIDESAFRGCSGLTSVTISDSITSIGEDAFSGCSGLTSVTIPNSVTSIGSSAFYNCNGLENIYITDIAAWCKISGLSNLMSYGSSSKKLYLNNELITDLVIPDSITSICDFTFRGCSGLTRITIPNSVTFIGNSAFQGCSGLTSIVIPDSVTSIGDAAFYSCSGLESMTLPFIGAQLNGTENTHFGYIFGAGSYGYNSKCVPSSLKTVIISNGSGVTFIGYQAFDGCSGLTSIVIPDSVTSIGDAAFYSCSGLESMTLPFIGAQLNGTENTHFGYIFGASYSSNNSSYVPSSLKTVIISNSSGITSIGNHTFHGCSGLTSIIIPNSVASIGNSAFDGCSGLTSIIIPNSVTLIGNSAFDGCSGLENIYYAGSIEKWCKISGLGNIMSSSRKLYIDNRKVVGELVIPDSVTSIGEYAFLGCSGLTRITIPNSVTSIGSGAFSGCSGLTSITISSSVTSIGNYAFSGCSGLARITISSSVTSIGNYAFSGCSGLARITIPNSVTSIGSSAFYDCSRLESITLPFVGAQLNGTENTHFGYIFGASYSSNNSRHVPSSLKTVIISNSGVTSIGKSAFEDCSGLTSIIISDSVTSIGYAAFRGCGGLTSVTIGNGVTSIGDWAFSDCGGFTKVIWNAENCTTAGSSKYSIFENCNNLTQVTIGENVKTIPSYAFWGCGGLTSVTIPNSVISIGKSAFEDCSGLESMTLPFVGARLNGTEDTHFGYIFGANSYSYNYTTPSSLKTVIISNSGVTSIGSGAFYGCSGITSITIPNSVTSIGKSAFSGCSGLESIYITDIAAWCKISGLDKLMQYGSNSKKLYLNNELITNLVIPDSVTSIGNYAFRGCSGITRITISDSVTSIGESAFSGCSGLESITLPFIGAELNGGENTHFGYILGAGSYGYNSKCVPSSLKTVIISSGSGVTSIDSNTFYGCSGLTRITIPNSVTSIGSGAFSGCSGLASITIPDSVTEIGDWAFYGCSKLTSITIPDSVTSIGSSAFYECYKLVEVINNSSLDITKGSASFGDVAYYALNVKKGGNSNIVNQGGYLFYTKDGTNYLLDYSGADTDLELPANYNGNSYEIYRCAFKDCSGLTSITIPSSVTSIGYSAFYNCSGLTSVTIPDSVTSIGYYAFYNCSGLTSVTIGNGVKSIGYYAFRGCSGLASVTIPDSVFSIGNYAFQNCSGLASITIGNSVTAIGDYAFQNCSKLTSITIPDSVGYIGEYAFKDCSKLQEINFNGTTGQWYKITKNVSWNNNVPATKVICSDGEISL